MIEPFLKWPGGKRWLAVHHADLLPNGFRRYIEPFLGGAAVFFQLSPSRAILADSNAELINAYLCVRDHANAIDKRLRVLHRRHGKTFYYSMRSTHPRSALGRAIRFLYLNRTCFNGIYRVNHMGEFNVPIGSKDEVCYPKGYLQKVSGCLQKAEIRVADFEATIDIATKGDFVFVDPPYTVKHNNNNFIKYNANLFSWADQVRLSAAIRRAVSRGAMIMMSNADHVSIRTLYCDLGIQHRVQRSSVLAAEPAKRCKTSELILTTYENGGEQSASHVREARGGPHAGEP